MNGAVVKLSIPVAASEKASADLLVLSCNSM